MEALASISLESQVSKKDFWFRHIELQISSGMGKKVYCDKNDLNYHTFTYWSRKYSPNQSDDTRLVAVKIKPEDNISTQKILCTLNFNDQYHLHIHDLSALAVILDKVR